MVAAGVRHDAVTLSHLLGALERVNAMSDCVQLAQLHETLRPGASAGGRGSGAAALRSARGEGLGAASAVAVRSRRGARSSFGPAGPPQARRTHAKPHPQRCVHPLLHADEQSARHSRPPPQATCLRTATRSAPPAACARPPPPATRSSWRRGCRRAGP